MHKITITQGYNNYWINYGKNYNIVIHNLPFRFIYDMFDEQPVTMLQILVYGHKELIIKALRQIREDAV